MIGISTIPKSTRTYIKLNKFDEQFDRYSQTAEVYGSIDLNLNYNRTQGFLRPDITAAFYVYYFIYCYINASNNHNKCYNTYTNNFIVWHLRYDATFYYSNVIYIYI